MPQFPQPHGCKRSIRICLGDPEPVEFKVGEQRIQGLLHKVSLTGGLVQTQSQLPAESVAEMVVRTKIGPVRGLVQFFATTPRAQSEQAFRFLALDDDDYARLCAVLGISKKP